MLRRRILVVDDDPDSRIILHDRLTYCGTGWRPQKMVTTP